MKMSAIVHDCVQEVEARYRIMISHLMQGTVNTFYEERKFNNLAIFRLSTHYKSSYKQETS